MKRIRGVKVPLLPCMCLHNAVTTKPGLSLQTHIPILSKAHTFSSQKLTGTQTADQRKKRFPPSINGCRIWIAGAKKIPK